MPDLELLINVFFWSASTEVYQREFMSIPPLLVVEDNLVMIFQR